MVPGRADAAAHIGLENVEDLKADLECGFAALKAAQSFDRRRPDPAAAIPANPCRPALRGISAPFAAATGFC